MKKAYIAFELVSFILAGGVSGWFIDRFLWSSDGIAPAVGIALGFFLWVIYIWKKFRF